MTSLPELWRKSRDYPISRINNANVLQGHCRVRTMGTTVRLSHSLKTAQARRHTGCPEMRNWAWRSLKSVPLQGRTWRKLTRTPESRRYVDKEQKHLVASRLDSGPLARDSLTGGATDVETTIYPTGNNMHGNSVDATFLFFSQMKQLLTPATGHCGALRAPCD